MSHESIQHWIKTAADYPVLTQKATSLLFNRLAKLEPGTEKHAKLVNKICLHNMRLVFTWTRGYCKQRTTVSWGSQKSLDLLQEGYFGLRKAVLKYDLKRGYTFATYANAWVRQAIGKYHVDTLSDIRVPESSAREIYYYDKHGKPRNGKVQAWVADASLAAAKAYSATSIDKFIDNGDDQSALIDTIREEQSLTHRTGEEQSFDLDYCYGVMERLGIEAKDQEVIMTYAKRGNLDTAMMKHSLPANAPNRRRIRAQIKQIKEYVGA